MEKTEIEKVGKEKSGDGNWVWVEMFLLLLAVFLVFLTIWKVFDDEKVQNQEAQTELIQEAQIEFIKKEIPDTLRITKENKDDILYDSEKGMDLYVVEGEDNNYKVSISKEKKEDSSFDYDIRVSSTNNRLSENK